MNSGPGDGVPEQAPGIEVTPLWSLPLPAGGSLLIVMPSGDYIVSTGTSLSAFDRYGVPQWNAPGSRPSALSEIVVAPDGVFIQIEENSIFTRALASGQVLGSFPAPRSSGLCLAPWGDLLYSQAAPQNVGSVRCVDRAGGLGWSVALDGSGPLVYEPLALDDVIVIARRGALWAYDHTGHARWVANNHGLRKPCPEDEHRQPLRDDPRGDGVRLFGAPARIDSGRAVIALQGHRSAGMYLLDGIAPQITPLAVPAPILRPFAVLPHAPTEFGIVGLGARVEVSRMDWRYPIVSFEPGGRCLWEHRLPAEPYHLSVTPGGNLIAAASASLKRWEDYGQWYDLTLETFVRCISPDGTAQWTWHAPGYITHAPVIGSDGTVYVGCEQKLWALTVVA